MQPGEHFNCEAPDSRHTASAALAWPRQRWLDRELQRQRIAQARQWIPRSVRILDVGCGDGALFRTLGADLGVGVGLDTRLARPFSSSQWTLRPGRFPDDIAPGPPYDVITMLAVLEHLPATVQGRIGTACAEHLVPGGLVIVTVPSPRVDGILRVLIRLGLVAGQAEEEHWGFNAAGTPQLFPPPAFELRARRTFQLGLNHLFVFSRA